MKNKNIIAATFNLRRDCKSDGVNRWEYRRNAVISMIRSLGADVIGVQELTPDMKADIEQELSEFVFIGKPRCSGSLAEHNDVLVRKNSFDIDSVETFWLSSNPHKFGSRALTAIFPRICTSVFLRDHAGTRIRIMNTHFDHISRLARNFEARLIKDRIEKFEKNVPTVLMGDLNSTPDSKTVKILVERGSVSLRDAVQEHFEKSNKKLLSTFHFFEGKKTTRSSIIDYIFVSRDISVLDATLYDTDIDGVYPSDHFPVMAKLAY